MLFWLTDLGELFSGSRPALDPEVIALDNFGFAGYSGHHVVLARRDDLGALANMGGLSPRSRAYFKSVSERITELGGLLRLMRHIQVSPTVASEVFRGGCWQVPLQVFRESSVLQRCALVAEDETDCTVLRSFAEIAASVVAPGCKVSVRPVPGGGANTFKPYQRVLREEECPTFCVVDSDRTFPLSACGTTAKKCLEVHQLSGVAWRDMLQLIEVRELENVIPDVLLEMVVKGNPDEERVTRDFWQIDRNIRGFVDLKSGEQPCRFHDIDPGHAGFALVKLAVTQSSISHPGFQQCGAGCASAACKVVPRLGENCLKQIAELLNRSEIRRRLQDAALWSDELRLIASELVWQAAALQRMG